ncbi:MAG: discoidin domain-containing protein [Actinoplanes sp.]
MAGWKRWAALGAVVVAAGSLVAVRWSSAPPRADAAVVALSPFAVPGRGADVPFTEQEAENAATNGTILAPDRHRGSLQSEASGRRAVTLDAVGEYVEFTLTEPANALSFRYSVPDGYDEASLDVVAGDDVTRVPVTSRYSWFYGEYPFTNTPGERPQHFYDEARTLLDRSYPAGAKVRLRVADDAWSPSFTIDLADFEQVSDPAAAPANALDVVADFGADPTGSTDATAKIQAAVDAGRAGRRPVFVPKGRFLLYGHITADEVTVQGAGPWYSVLGGRDPVDRRRAAGLVGDHGLTVKDLAIIGDVTERDNAAPVSAFEGRLAESTLTNVWLQHTKAGVWVNGPTKNFVLRDSRILDQTADGVNFHRGVTGSRVENTFVRNTGDDGLAMWSDGVANRGNSFVRNTVVAPVLANNIAVYGGSDMTISDNVVADTVTNGGGLHVANRFDGVGGKTAVSGTFTLARNTLIRAGNADSTWTFGIGALWFDGLNAPLTGAALTVTATDIVDSSYAALQTVEGAVSGLSLTDVAIIGTGTYALQLQATGSAVFRNVTATGIAQPAPIYRCPATAFPITDAGGNSGWQTGTPACGAWPPPQWREGFSAPPRAAATPGATSAPATPSAPGGAAQASGPSAPARPSATKSAKPIKNAARLDKTTDYARGRKVTESGHADVYPGANVTDGDVTTYWESVNNRFPGTVTIDLGQARTLGRFVLRLPPQAEWNSRTQTLSLLGSTDGRSFGTLKAASKYTFTAKTGNRVTITANPRTARYLRVSISANSGWPAGQLSEVEAYGG